MSATGILLSALFLSAVCVLAFRCNLTPPAAEGGVRIGGLTPSAFWGLSAALFAAALVLRVVLGYTSTGYSNDIATFKAWASTLNNVGFSHIYEQDMFLDYPPGYLYVLSLLDHMRQWFGLPYDAPAYTLLVKLPSILADLAIGGVILWLARRRLSDKTALFFAAAWLFSPVVVLNSAQWGQVDAFCLAILLASVLLLYRGNIVPSGLLYGLAVICKPQILVFAPLYFFWMAKQKKWGKLLLGTACAVAAVLLAALPFTTNFNFLWLLEEYQATLGSYNCYSVNAFNFWAMLGLNWAGLREGFVGQLPTLFAIVVATGFSGLLVLCSKHKAALFACPAALMSIMYLFGGQMHERYLYPSLLCLLLCVIWVPDRRLLLSYGLVTAMNYLNCFHVLDLFLKVGPAYDPNSSVIRFLSVLQVAAICYSLYVLLDLFVLRKAESFAAKKAAPPAARTTGPLFAGLFRAKEPFLRPQRQLGRSDLLIVLSLTAVYAVLAFWGLGDRQTALTPWAPAQGQSVTLEADASADTLIYIPGLVPDAEHYRARVGLNIKVESSTDGITYTDCGTLTGDPVSVFAWIRLPLTVHEDRAVTDENGTVTTQSVAVTDTNGKTVPAPGRYIRLTPLDGNAVLNEVGLIDTAGGVTVPLTAVSGDGAALVDEQNVVPVYVTYENSAAFDEIYHARTAYEHILELEPYENTHPTLGKLIIALGIQIFGMNPFGWRFMGTLLGVLMLPVLYHLLRSLFPSRLLCTAGTLVFAFDFMHYTQTRIATIDTYAVFFLLLMYDAMLCFMRRDLLRDSWQRLLLPLLLCGVFTGLGCASKWTAVYGALGLAVLFFGKLIVSWQQAGKEPGQRALLARRNKILCLWCCLFFLAIPFALYFAAFLPIVLLPHQTQNLFSTFWNYQTTMFNYHSGLHAVHAFSSPWYEWPFIIKPIWYFSSDAVNAQGQYGTVAALGNPMLWWPCIPAIFYTGYALFKHRDRAAFLALSGFLSAYLPWVLIPRLTFIYHYFTAVPFLVVGLLLCVERLLQTRPLLRPVLGMGTPGQARGITLGQLLLCGFVLLNLIAFVLYFPVLSGAPTSKGYVELLRLFPGWYF